MARCRSYLQGLDVCVTVLLLLFEALSVSDGSVILQVFGPITVLLSVVGICAASLDVKILLILFSALIFVEFLALLIVASSLVSAQAQLDGAVDKVFMNVTPLYQADFEIQRELNKLQASDSCCGLKSFEDWDHHFPVSCFCMSPTPPPLNTVQNPRNLSTDPACVFVEPSDSHSVWVHSVPCGPILKSYLSFPIKVRIGIISAFATLSVRQQSPPIFRYILKPYLKQHSFVDNWYKIILFNVLHAKSWLYVTAGSHCSLCGFGFGAILEEAGENLRGQLHPGQLRAPNSS
ncbi:uncharacterized protein LOC128758166 isoform X2 [Synchiropus splendidus]|uniref:uncharacterized protein LOC128758166 isoform X2 n=1 Tax=Synchiropus splendidus TaxID=270530 RepID=UPI00237ED817|nr:uncharacterized protein LOC128758166 isoform X2 [Synchiropus splendidus]